MSLYEWRSGYPKSPSRRPATEAQLAAIETEFDWPLPETVRSGMKADYSASIFKGGKRAMHVVSGPRREGGRFLASFQRLNRPSEVIGASRTIREWVANQKGSWHSDVVVISEGGGGEMLCLRYGADGRAESEVWWLNAMMPTMEEGFYKVADTFDEFIEKLITDDEYVRLGFEL